MFYSLGQESTETGGKKQVLNLNTPEQTQQIPHEANRWKSKQTGRKKNKSICKPNKYKKKKKKIQQKYVVKYC